MEPFSIFREFPGLVLATSQVLQGTGSWSDLGDVDRECNELCAELNKLQEMLSQLGPDLSMAEKLQQAYRSTLSEAVTASTVSLEELLSVVKGAQRCAVNPSRKRLAYIGLTKALTSTRDTIHHQRENISLALSLGLQAARLDGLVDVAKDKNQHENPTVTGFCSRIYQAPARASTIDSRGRIPYTSSLPVWMMPEHPGCGSGSDEREMEGGRKMSQPEKHLEGTGSELSPRQLDLGSHPAAGARADHTNRFNVWKELAGVASKAYCWTLFSRCAEGGLIVVGAAGAAMMGCSAQTLRADIWSLGHIVSALLLNPDSMQASSAHGDSLPEPISLPTPLPKTVFDSPATLVTSIVVTTLAMTAYHYRHRSEKYQDPLIFAIAGGGALAGRLAGLDGTGVLLRVVPWCVLFSLLLSAAWSPRLEGKEDYRVEGVAMGVGLKAGALDSM